MSNTSPSSKDPDMPMACYGVQQRSPPEANDPNILLKTKNHPMLIVVNNPLDPIYYSTCYVRTILKVWLPLEDGFSAHGSGNTAPPRDFWTLRHGQCLHCDSYDKNYLNKNFTYDSLMIPTPQWYMAPSPAPCTPCLELTPPPTTQEQAAAEVGAAAAASVPAPTARSDSITSVVAATVLTPQQELALQQLYCREYAAYSGIPIEYLACHMEVDAYGSQRRLLAGSAYILSVWTSYVEQEDALAAVEGTASPTTARDTISFAEKLATTVKEEAIADVVTEAVPEVIAHPPPADQLQAVRVAAATALEATVVEEVEVVLEKIEKGEELTEEEKAAFGVIEGLLNPGPPTETPSAAPTLTMPTGGVDDDIFSAGAFARSESLSVSVAVLLAALLVM